MTRADRLTRLPSALRIRHAIEEASALRSCYGLIRPAYTHGHYGPDRILAAVLAWSDREWSLVSGWAGVPAADELTREIAVGLLRERVAVSV